MLVRGRVHPPWCALRLYAPHLPVHPYAEGCTHYMHGRASVRVFVMCTAPVPDVIDDHLLVRVPLHSHVVVTSSCVSVCLRLGCCRRLYQYTCRVSFSCGVVVKLFL